MARQKLITKAIEKELLAHPIGSQDEVPVGDRKILVKFFYPYGRGTWYVTEAERQDTELTEEWLFYGYCESPLGPDCDEWGYVLFTELTSIVKFGRPAIERDMYAPPKFMREVLGD